MQHFPIRDKLKSIIAYKPQTWYQKFIYYSIYPLIGIFCLLFDSIFYDPYESP